MGNIESYRHLTIPTSTPAADRLPVQLAVLDEDVPAVIARIASSSPDPFDKLEIIDDGLDISWMVFGWQEEHGDFYGGSPGVCCCYEWAYVAEGLAEVRAEWGSMEIPEDRRALVPESVFRCIAKLLNYLGSNGIPATVCIAHHFICIKGEFLQHDNWPFPLHNEGDFERIGLDIIKQTRQFSAWLKDQTAGPPRFNTQQLMENVRRLGNTPNGFLGFGIGLLFADLGFEA